ncbi:protein FLX-like 1 isoform X3 [Papaver somniferum]|uniref:protein FLX-like 1 isoform X3 n=1 Tax=Papaver somniferum TaxID=3469 RepID=UPI000E701219|nr:protein FLX-like 1 isoform X3 [Papaver somniferum]
MSGRNRHHPVHESPQYGRERMPHPALLEEMRDAQFGRGPPPPRSLIPHPAVIEERLAVQHQEIQGLLVDNQRLAATHVALKQELAAAQYELQRMSHVAGSMHSEKDIQLRELYDKSIRMEADLHAFEAMRGELLQVHSDVQKLSASKQELTGQVQALTQDLNRANSEKQQIPALKAEIENMKQELQRARSANELDKKEHAQNFEHGQAMEKNLITMAREVEKLRAEMANAEKRARASAAVGNAGAGYNATYGNQDTGYAANPYPATYGMNPVQGGADGNVHYGPGPGAWGAYDMQQRAHGRR